MTFPQGSYFRIGRRLTLLLALFIALILGANGLIIYQFFRAQLQTDRLTGVSQQLIGVLRLQESLRSFHEQLNALVRSRDWARLESGAEPLRAALLKQTRETRRTLGYLPAGFRVDPAFLTALDTIEVTLPSQLRDVTMLARAGDWDMVRLRLDDELNRIETTTAALVKSLDQDLDEELPRVVINMRDVQSRIVLIVPLTAIATVFMAAFFGWAVAGRIIQLQLEERINERMRIARDLHDTLLQSFQAVLMKFHAVEYLLPDHSEARKRLESVTEQTRLAIVEARDAVQGLRSATADHDLAEVLESLRDELIGQHAGHTVPEYRVEVEGTSRELVPALLPDLHRIAGEAVRNAFRHAQATRIDVRVRYERNEFLLLVADNGKGIDPTVLDARGRPGHFGLPGMMERAKSMGGKLVVRDGAGAGTEVELSIPSTTAYRKSPPSERHAVSGDVG